MNRIIIHSKKIDEKKKHKKPRMRQPFLMEQEYTGNQIQNRDNQDIDQYHDYERFFETR